MSDLRVNIWDVSSGVCLHTLSSDHRTIPWVAFNGDLTWAVSVSDSTVKIWDVSRGKCRLALEGLSRSFRSQWAVAFTHDSTRLAATSDDNTVKIWDTISGKCLQMLGGHHEPIWKVSRTASYDP